MLGSSEATFNGLCLCVAASTICWTVLYHVLFNTKLSTLPEFYCRMVTVIHAFVVVILAAECYWQGPDPYLFPGESNTLLQDLTLVISLGYFCFDLGWCLYHQTEPVIMLVHHIVSVLSIGYVLLGRSSGGEAVAGILNLEITNPLLQLRWFLRTAGYNKTVVHTCVELFFVVSFIFVRLVIGSFLTYCIVTNNKPKIAVKLCTLSLHMISLAFIYYILKFIQKKYSRTKEKGSD